MASSADSSSITVCINEALTDDELRSVLAKLESQRDKEVFGLVCKRWLHLQSTERKRLSARAGPHMLRRMADRFSRLHELDLSQSISRSFYPGVIDSDLRVIAHGFKCLRVLNLQNCIGILFGVCGGAIFGLFHGFLFVFIDWGKRTSLFLMKIYSFLHLDICF